MAEQFKRVPSPASFEYELVEGDPSHIRTVVATPNQTGFWIHPVSLILNHRIGRGAFGDVWLATRHQSGDDCDEYHEVVLKMFIYQLKEDHLKMFFDRFKDIFRKIRDLRNVCWLHGVSIKNGKICIAMKLYEGSVGDRMARLKEGKLPLSDVIRYGIDLAKGILELHSLGVLILNLKPSNFLLNDQDQVILGDIGIPYFLLGIPLTNHGMAFRLGTTNYMAPEQWEPEIRGPVSFETDSWGFGCSIVEMLTGAPPWAGKSVEEIYQSVVVKQEKIKIPSGLPLAVENVLIGCFEYDLRNRPLIADILLAFESSQNAVYCDGDWNGIRSKTLVDKLSSDSHTAWFLSKDHLQVGDIVRSRKSLNSQKSHNLDEGTVVGLVKDTDRGVFVLVKVQGIHSPFRVNVSTLERVTCGLAVGDWVRLKDECVNSYANSSVGILHSIARDGNVTVGFLGLPTLWKGNSSDLHIAEHFHVGQFVRLKGDLVTPRFKWPRKTRYAKWATGKISQILPSGCVVVNFPGKFVFGPETNTFLADPDEVENVSFKTCDGVVEYYQHLEDFHWCVRPLVIAFSLFTIATELGFFSGKNVRANPKNGRVNHEPNDSHRPSQEGKNTKGARWFG